MVNGPPQVSYVFPGHLAVHDVDFPCLPYELPQAHQSLFINNLNKFKSLFLKYLTKYMAEQILQLIKP